MTASLEKIEKKIRETGQKEMEEIEKQADGRIEAIRAEIADEAQKAYHEASEKRKSEIDLVPRRMVSDARLEKKKEIDQKKTEMVDAVFQEAKSRILKLGKKEKAAAMKALADSGARNIGDAVLFVDKEYADLIDAKTEDLKDFGVIVRSKDGSTSVDNTLDSIMGQLQLKLKPRIVKTLFKEA